jgi:hypothetical protein
MSLSVFLVTRNHEQSVGRAIQSVAGLADEVVVAETGSTDRTAAVAAEAGARVVPCAWDADFAAACNLALDQATGDWLLLLNPDEELREPDRERLREALRRPDVLGCYVTIQDQLRADQPDIVTETVQLRLFRRHPGLRYVGRLHPHFAEPPEELARREGKQLLTAPVAIRRHGYLSTLTEGKLKWARRLLERELEDRPGQLHYLFEYGHTLLLLKDPRGHEVMAEAAEQLLAARDAPAAPDPSAGPLLEYLLAVSPEQSRSGVSREQAEELARRWFPHSPPLLWRLAEAAFQRQDFRRAAGYLAALVQMGETGRYDRSLGFDPSIIGDAARMNLGVACLRSGDLVTAEVCFRRLVQSPKYAESAVKNLGVIERLRQARGQA